MKRFIIIALLLALLPGAALAADGGLTVSGRLVNDADPVASLGGIEVSLHSYAGGSLGGTATAVTDDGGAFRFEGVGTGQEHLVSAAYQGVDYYQPAVFEPGQTEAFVELHVVPATDSDAAVSAVTRHVVIDFDNASPRVTEIIRMANSANATLFNGEHSLAFTLPPGAAELGVLSGNIDDYRLGADGTLRLLLPFPPGEAELVFSYALPPAADGGYDVSFTADYAAEELEVLLSGEGIEVTSPQLVPADPVVTAYGRQYLHYTLSGLARGDGFSLAVRRLPGDSYAWLGWTLAAIAVIAAAWGVLRGRRRGGA